MQFFLSDSFFGESFLAYSARGFFSHYSTLLIKCLRKLPRIIHCKLLFLEQGAPRPTREARRFRPTISRSLHIRASPIECVRRLWGVIIRTLLRFPASQQI